MGKRRRYDSKRRVLRSGERERPDGYYVYRWTDRFGKRHSITTKTLEELRQKESGILKNNLDGIRSEAVSTTVNDIFALWCRMKRGLKNNTFQNYQYMYNMFVASDFGRLKLQTLKKSDVKQFYNTLLEERCLRVNTIDNIHTVLHQVLQVAVEDGYLRSNVSDNVLKELKQSHNIGKTHKKALTIPEQNLFQNFLKPEDSPYHHWYPIFAVMLGTGLRVGELTCLQWSDIDWEENAIEVNQTLVYYNHAENGCYFNVHTPKTEAGKRRIPMLQSVKEALLEEMQHQEQSGLRCTVEVDGYTDFIFLNRFGSVHHQGTLNKALRRIIRDCNDRQLDSGEKNPVLLPPFSCHSLRHTFTTRMVESGVNVKVVQGVLGHKDVSTTLEIYADLTKEFAQSEFKDLDEKLKANMASVDRKQGGIADAP